MKALLAALLVFTACEAKAVVALHHTEDGRLKIQAIQAQIRAANRLDSEVNGAEQNLARAKTAKASKAELHQLELQLEREKDKQRAAYTKAIHMTLDAYDLHPRIRAGTSVMPQTRGRVIEWLPIAHDRAAREVRAADGSVTRVPQPRLDLAGAAYPDGVVFIDPSTFKHPAGVGYLASTLLHERTHFEQYITAGRGDVMTVAKAQREAYDAERKHSGYFFDDSIPAQKAAIDEVETLWAEEDAKVEAREQRDRTFVGRLRNWYEPETLSTAFDARPRTNEELAAIKQGAERLRAEIASENAERTARINHPRLGHMTPLTAPRAADEAPQMGYMKPLPAPSRASEPPIGLPVPLPIASVEVYHLARRACLGDWNGASHSLSDFYRLTEEDLRILESNASGGDCLSILLSRLVAMRRGGEALDFARLQRETQAIQSPPPVHQDPIERDRRSGGCIKRGVWFPQC